MYQGRTLESFAAEIIRRKDNMKDYVVHTKQMHMEKGDLFFGDENVSHSFPVNTIAAQQIAAFTGIPSVYYHRMREQNPALLDHNINAWFQDMDALRMVRTLDSAPVLSSLTNICPSTITKSPPVSCPSSTRWCI